MTCGALAGRLCELAETLVAEEEMNPMIAMVPTITHKPLAGATRISLVGDGNSVLIHSHSSLRQVDEDTKIEVSLRSIDKEITIATPSKGRLGG